MPNHSSEAFFLAAANELLLRTVIGSLQGTSFVIKDRLGRYVAASDGAYQRYGLASEAEILGRTDYDFISKTVADRYVKADRMGIELTPMK